MTMERETLNIIAAVVLRYAITVLFLWFGMSEILNPEAWTVWLPEWFVMIPLDPVTFMWANGVFEVTFAVLLGLGLFTRFVASVLALHLFSIAVSLGYNDVGVRDFVLGLATLSIGLRGADPLAFDRWLRKSVWGHTSFARFFHLYEREKSK